MRDGNSETETELQAAERRISKIQRCGAARVASMEQSFLGLLEAIGEDPQRAGLLRTPNRAARAFEFLTAGYRQSLDGIINNALFESEASEIILVKDIELYSLCEHHLIPFIGKAHVAYIPNGKHSRARAKAPSKSPKSRRAMSKYPRISNRFIIITTSQAATT